MVEETSKIKHQDDQLTKHFNKYSFGYDRRPIVDYQMENIIDVHSRLIEFLTKQLRE